MTQIRSGLNRPVAGKSLPQRQVFTFFIEDMLFGLDVGNVLMLSQDVAVIQRLPVEERGLCGVSKFQGQLVPVIDLAHKLKLRSGLDARNELLQLLTDYQRAYQRCYDALATAARYDQAFDQQLIVEQHSLQHWRQRSSLRDETLQELLSAMLDAHAAFNQHVDAASKLLLSAQVSLAEQQLQQNCAASLRQLQLLSHRAREQLQNNVRQVLLYVTDDGKTPRYALLIDDINDVIAYNETQFQASNSGTLAQIPLIEQVLSGIISREQQADCLLFDINKITARLPEPL